MQNKYFGMGWLTEVNDRNPSINSRTFVVGDIFYVREIKGLLHPAYQRKS